VTDPLNVAIDLVGNPGRLRVTGRAAAAHASARIVLKTSRIQANYCVLDRPSWRELSRPA
jgi:hypothetical protein